MSGGRITTATHIRTRLHWPRHEQKGEIVRVYLPPDANCLLSVMDHCLRSRHYVNVVIAGKHPAPQWLTMEAAAAHCSEGIGIWQWAGNDQGSEPDVVMACCGDVPTLETLAAVSILHQTSARLENSGGQRRRSPEAAAEHRPPARPKAIQISIHSSPRIASHLCVPWIPMVGPPADLPSYQPRELARPRLQRGRHDHHRLRHDRA